MRFIADGAGHLGSIHSFPEQKVLYRSDTRAPLSVVSQRYKVVQPEEVLEFYRNLTEHAGYELETAGVLKGGRKFWALARSGLGTAIKGQDQVNAYLLVLSGRWPDSCDRYPRSVGQLASWPVGQLARPILTQGRRRIKFKH